MNQKRLLLELLLYVALTLFGIMMLFTRPTEKVEPTLAPVENGQPPIEPKGGISVDTVHDQQSEYRTA